MKDDLLYFEGDLYLFENFNTIKSIFSKLGYNLIIKEHRKKEKKIKYYLDYTNEFDDTFELFSEKMSNSLQKYFSQFIKPYIDECNKLYPSIVDNKYEKEIFKYSDIALIGSSTSIANILYSYNCRCLVLRNVINKDCIDVMSEQGRLEFEYKNKNIIHDDLLYGISVKIDEFHKNIDKYIKDIINMFDHPYYGNVFITNYEYFSKIIQHFKNK